MLKHPVLQHKNQTCAMPILIKTKGLSNIKYLWYFPVLANAEERQTKRLCNKPAVV